MREVERSGENKPGREFKGYFPDLGLTTSKTKQISFKFEFKYNLNFRV
jgi:hypothetical protein